MKRWLFGLLGIAVLLGGCAAEKGGEPSRGTYPLQTDVELTHWLELNNDLSYSTNQFGETPFAKELEKQTGVKVKYISPVAGQSGEALNLLIASRELPDLISYPWYYYSGGADRAMMENVIQPLTEIIPKYSPNLNAYLESHPDVKKMVKSDNGQYLVYPFIRGDESLTAYVGPMVRRDLLEATGRQTLETVEDWHGFLTDMKNRGVEKPLTMNKLAVDSGFLIGAYGILRYSYVEDGTVVFGGAQPAYQDYLATMRAWYQEGLIDKDFLSSNNMVNQNMIDSSSAATVGYAGSTMGALLKALQEQNPSYDLIGVPNPVMRRGETPKFIKKDFLFTTENCVGISTQCRQTEVAARYLDYGYSQQGRMLFNYGVEGESYVMQDGQPVYTDTILHNSDGLSAGQALALYTKNYSGPYIQEKRYAELYYTYPQQQQALKVWGKSDVEKYRLPLISVSEDEYEDYARIDAAVTAYVEQAYAEFVTGVRPLDTFEEYVDGLHRLELDRLLEIQQAAYERYQKK